MHSFFKQPYRRMKSAAMVQKFLAVVGRYGEDSIIPAFHFVKRFHVALQLHVVHDVGTQWSRCVCQGRALESRMELFGNGSAADLRPPFQQQRFEPSFCQIERRD